MTETGPLSGVGELTKPATVLVERISDAVGGLFKPYQIVRVARAEAEADRIRAEAGIEIADIHRRALRRFLQEEASKQLNIERIAALALPEVVSTAAPEQVESDWLTNFFDKCRLTSDEQLQQVWARILAGEANSPGRFSRRTVNLVASLDKADAEQFTALCSLCWAVDDGSEQYRVPIVINVDHEVYSAAGVTFASVSHLDAVGLIRFSGLAGFLHNATTERAAFTYFGSRVDLTIPKGHRKQVSVGKVLLTKMGEELASVCHAARNESFFHYIVDHWRGEGYSPQ